MEENVFLTVDKSNTRITGSITNAPTTLVPTIQIVGSNISPDPGVAQDFRSNVTYTVTARDKNTTNYTVSIANYYQVIFDGNGGQISRAPQYIVAVSNGEKVTPPAIPTQEHFGFTGWFTNQTGGNVFNTNTPITQKTTLYAQWTNKPTFAGIVLSGQIPTNLDGYDELSKTIFSRNTAGAGVTTLYVKTNGTSDGTSWTNATNDLRGAIDGISDAANTNVYVVLVASGKYINASTNYSMKNHVAIIGGFTAGTYNRTGETRLEGDRSRVFDHDNNGLYDSALLYGVTITNGSVSVNDYGAGMYNGNSSPTLINVTFSGNTATFGGGMYNQQSSPILFNTLIWGNINSGGGSHIYYSLIQGGIVNAFFPGVITNDPGTLTFGGYGGGVKTVSITEGSAAKDKGVYVRGVKTGNSYAAGNMYYSTDNATWYRANDGTPATPPGNADDLTSTTDARWYVRDGRPDIGAYEVGRTAP